MGSAKGRKFQRCPKCATGTPSFSRQEWHLYLRPTGAETGKDFGRQAKIFNASRVFLSLPSQRTIEQQAHVVRFTKMLEEHGELPRSEYSQFGQLSEVRRRISGCSGAAIFGFTRLQDNEDIPFPSETKSPTIQQHLTPTPWNHIEAGIAFVLDLPLLVMLLREFNQEFLIKLYQSSLCSDFCWTATGR